MQVNLRCLFTVQAFLVASTITGILVGFSIATTKALDNAIEDAVQGNLRDLHTSIKGSLQASEDPIRSLLQLTRAFKDEAHRYNTPSHPTYKEFLQHLDLHKAIMDAYPLLAYTYQSYLTREGFFTDLGCGKAVDPNGGPGTDHYCSLGNQSAWDIIVLSDKGNNVDRQVDDEYFRDPTDEDYIKIIRGLGREYNTTGYWALASVYYDPETKQAVPSATYSIPMEFDANGNCTLAMSGDVAMSWLASRLRTAAKTDNTILVVDYNTWELQASSLPVSEMVQFNEVNEETHLMWVMPNSPSDKLNRYFNTIRQAFLEKGDLPDSATVMTKDGDMLLSAIVIRQGTQAWLAIDYTPRDWYFGEARRVQLVMITVSVVVVSLLIAASLGISLLVVRPLATVSRAMASVARLEDNNSIGEASGPALQDLQPIFDSFAKLDTAIQSFTRYVPKGVVKDLLNTNQLCRLEMVQMHCTMLFVDIVGFTSIAERVPIRDLSVLVNTYFDESCGIVRKHGGTIDKFIGDCIMAVWGAPICIDNPEVRASLCALRLAHVCKIDPLTSLFGSFSENLAVRVGVNSGEVLAGNLGATDRLSYTVIGDPVNTASRLESLNKMFGTSVMVADSVAVQLPNEIITRLLSKITVVGKSDPIEVFELLGVAAGATLTVSREEREPEISDSVMMTVPPDEIPNLVRRISDRRPTSTVSTSPTHLAAPRPAFNEVGPDVSINSLSAMRDGTRLTRELLEDAQRLLSVDPATLHFAKIYSLAVRKFCRSEFGHCNSLLTDLRGEYPQQMDVASARQLCDLAEAYLVSGAPANFNGVIRASNK